MQQVLNINILRKCNPDNMQETTPPISETGSACNSTVNEEGEITGWIYILKNVERFQDRPTEKYGNQVLGPRLWVQVVMM